MAPKLYSIAASPPVRAVYMCAKALDLELDVVFVNLLAMEHLKDDFLKRNPQHTVPVLEDDDGFIVSDSHAIMGYLVAKYGKNDDLYPKDDYKQRTIIDQMLYLDSSTLFARGRMLSRPLVYEGIQPTEERLNDLKEAWEILEKILEQNKTEYVAGNRLSIADFSIVTTLTSWNVFVPYSDFPNIKSYVERVQELPCYEVNKKGLAQYEALITSKWQK